MLLDELLAERERVQTPVPVLSVDPVAIPPTIETGRRAVRQRLAVLENAAVRNYRSAEEARRVLLDEHQRLEQELTARTHAQQEAAALRRELERLNSEEGRRSAHELAKAERTARAAIAGEIKHFQDEHERVVQEMAALRSSLSEHDGLLDEYIGRLRDEQVARAELRAELERAEAARSLAERSLQRATENARHGAEDEMIRLATAEQELADARSDRDRFKTQLDELTSGDGAIGRMTAQLEEKDAEILSLGVRVAELAEQTEADTTRARDLDKTLGKLRREARDASNARRTAEESAATVEAERDELRARVGDLEAESVRARADGDRLRAHAALLGDELAAARATVAELQAAASAPVAPVTRPETSRPETSRPETSRDESFDESSQRDLGGGDADGSEHAPLPLRIAGRHAPAPPLARRRPRRDSTGPSPASAPPATTTAALVGAFAPPRPVDPEPEPTATEAVAEIAPVADIESEPIAAHEVEAETPARKPPAGDASRRTAFAEFTALASSSGDDFSFRRR